MDGMELEFSEPMEECQRTACAIFKTPMVIDNSKLHPHTMCESSGYVSASSPEPNSTSSSLPCRTLMRRISNDSQLSVSPDCSSTHSNILRSIDVSPDSGFGCESFYSSRDSVILGLDEEMPVQLSSGTKRPAAPELLSSVPSVRIFPSSGSRPKLWQSTPVNDNAKSISANFTDSCDFERSPTKRQRASHKTPSRELFQTSKRKGTCIFPQPLFGDIPCTSKTERLSFVGRETVDFLYYLGKRSVHQPALDAILGYLEPADLCRASCVSRSWKIIVESIPTIMQRKQDHIDKCAQMKENLHQPVKKTTGILPFRGQLIEVQNFNFTEEVPSPGMRSPPVSPSKVRFNLFLKEGRKLESGQTLVQCPQCMLPARKEAERAARCTRRGCQFYFCILCLCKFHSDKLCPVSSVKHRKRLTAIGSRESRRNLLRLCK